MNNNFINKFDKQVSTFGPKEIMAAIFFVVLCVIIYFTFFHVDRTPYGYTEISEELASYLAGSDSSYSEDYNSGKMLVLYVARRDKEYKYPKQFQDALDVAIDDSEMGELYNFRELQILRNNILFEGEKAKESSKEKKNSEKLAEVSAWLIQRKKLYISTSSLKNVMHSIFRKILKNLNSGAQSLIKII